MKIIQLLIALVISSKIIFGQYTSDYGRIELVTLGAGTGFSSFIGDLGTKGEASKLANIRSFYFINFERRFGNIIGTQIDASIGKLAYNEHSTDILKNRNFESKITQIGANLVLHFNNDLIIKKDNPFAPYISAGVHYFKFNSYTDLKDKNGKEYKYWSDGTIADTEENHINAPNANILYRDYVYETKLKDSTTNYSNSSIAIPLTVGLKWKIIPRFHGRIFGTYNILFTDWVDNVKANSNNDKNINVGFGLHYVLRMKNKERRHLYDDVDFTAVETSDSDGDGIPDNFDECQNTPKDIEVDGFGCPLDSDGDGVPDYLDKEKGTKKGAIVDEKGRTLTDEILKERKEALQAISTQRKTTFSEDASTATLDKIFDEIKDNKTRLGRGIPPHLKDADINNDGLISPQEITNAMDKFFDGDSFLSVSTLYELIDYFFEQ